MVEPTNRRMSFIDLLPSQRDSPMSAQATGLGFGHLREREPQRGDPMSRVDCSWCSTDRLDFGHLR